MSNTRLKYYTAGKLQFTDWFTIGPNLIIRGYIHTESYRFYIVDFAADVMFESQADNLRQAKTLLKQQLALAGVSFTGEIRQ